MTIAGRTSAVKVATTSGGTYTSVDEIRSVSMNEAGATIDVSSIGNTFVDKILGIKDARYQLQGFYDPDDTNGQVAIRNAWLNDSNLFVQFLPDGTNGFQQEVKVTSFDLSASFDGAVQVSIGLDGSGSITAV